MSMIAALMLTCTVMCADVSGKAEVPKPEPTVAVTTQAQRTQHIENVESVGFKLYTIHGVTPSEELQRHLYTKLVVSIQRQIGSMREAFSKHYHPHGQNH